MEAVVTLALVVVAVIHLLPLSGVLGVGRLAALYGLEVEDPSLAVLLRHRAVLFGLVGTYLGIAAFVPAQQGWGLGVGFISVLSFLGLARPVTALTAEVARVVRVDLVALGALIVGATAWLVTVLA